MKKVILSAIAIMLFVFVNAQEVRYGIKGGVNLSSWVGDTKGMNLKPIIGVNLGVLAQIKLTDELDIQPEVLYSTQGTKMKNVGADLSGRYYTGDIKTNVSYINIPVLFKYSLDGKSFFEAGPQVGFLMSAKTATKLSQYSQTVNQDAKEFLNLLILILS